MKVWMIWVQEDDHGTYTWLEAAWTDDQTESNHDGWQEEVNRVRKMVAENDFCQYRIQAVNVPGAVELFDIPEVTAEAA